MVKWNTKQKRISHQRLGLLDLGPVLLRTLRLLSNFFYTVIFLFGMMGFGMAFGYLASQIESVKVPSKESLVKQVESLTMISQMNYSDNSLISTLDTDLLRTPVANDAISENIKKAIVSTEDEHFQEHKGVVPKAVFRATLASVLGFGEASGGSTLTQQLVKQQVLGDDPTFKRKSKEIVYALALERYMSKDNILGDYLNVSPFGRNNKGQNIAGVEEAARGIFGVSAKDLTVPQAAFLAGLPQSPIVYSPYLSTGQLKSEKDMAYGIKRQQNVLYNMYRTGVLSKKEYEDYKAYPIQKDFIQPGSAIVNNHDYLYYTVLADAKKAMYSYLIKRDKVSSRDLKNDETKAAYEERALTELQQGGYTITTTINKPIYNAMQTAAAQFGGLLDDGTGTVQMGNVLTDNATGAVLGFVGGRDYALNQNNHAFNTVRSPGSSIKPIIAYGPAIDQGLMGSASVLSNYPTTYSSGQKIMHADSEGTAMMPLQEALNTSWNIPAFWTQKLLREKGVDVENYMTKMGYKIADYSIESLPLGGGIEVSVAQQTNAYQMLSNNGLYQKQYIVDKITASDGTVVYKHENKPIRIFSAATATILQELLRGPITSGATTTFKNRLAAINPWLANADWIGKTGTTENYTDVWLVLSTPKVTLGGWAGHDDNTSLAPLTGYNNNSNYLAYLANAINQADPNVIGVGQRFNLDPGVIKANVLKSTGLQPGTVNVNGHTFSVGGEMTTSLWSQKGPGAMTYRFAIGGTDADYQKAWGNFGFRKN
ncbi:TPA: penicillin-binding protein [Streptococcus pyogenes]|uniref:penicillin-binding protein PBP1B n=1 Tax=Streptococcus pyogenes TaxID=1314 RepID=UPI00000D9714|nr:penicillin-binding protein PBP1B [Streptococcus pyogenes]HER4721064.1 penicillin-binding protein [Streptococcus pyogenes NGAS308]HER4769006.1 penicillin-binding protein [Streptococcus pyogenes NGAS209]AAL96911.1 putative penicillin-binding protein 1b [Streptococcus pyogenes MGAS8232]ESA57778.1 transglycosylase [Streptococcus pyogenes GA41394]MDA6092027.1 penicillin-binding protein PBP1B [Streptococcus pyogenes]